MCREQERVRKAEQVKLEGERILAEQQAAVAAKQAELAKREEEKDKVVPLDSCSVIEVQVVGLIDQE